jgi:hypothetical protein
LARATKNQEKDRSPIKCFSFAIPNYKLPVLMMNQTKPHLICAITRPRPTTTCSGQLAVRLKAVVKREGGLRTGVCLMIIIGNASFYFGTWKKNSFFWWFFVARANQKIRILALGGASKCANLIKRTRGGIIYLHTTREGFHPFAAGSEYFVALSCSIHSQARKSGSDRDLG